MNRELSRPTSFSKRDSSFSRFHAQRYSEHLEEDSEETDDEKGVIKELEEKGKPQTLCIPGSVQQVHSRRSSRGNLFGKVTMSNREPSRSSSFNTSRDRIKVQELRRMPPKSPNLSISRPQSPHQPSHPSSPLSAAPSINRRSFGPPDSKLVVVGFPCVGKSAVVVRILTGRFIWEYDPTLEAVYRHYTTVDDDPATIEILDTAGLVEGRVSEGHIRWADGFLIVYSLTDRSSFLAVPDIHSSIANIKHSPNFPCVVLANKSDLVHLSKVTEEEATSQASDLGVAFFSASACEGSPALWEALTELHRDVVARRIQSRSRRRSSAKVVIEGFYKMFSR